MGKFDDTTVKGVDSTGNTTKRVTYTEENGSVRLDVSAKFGDMENVIAMTRSAGFHDGEVYDTLIYTDVSETVKTLEFQNEGLCRFIITATLTGNDYTLSKALCTGFLLQENGDYLLQETGDKIIISGFIPA